MRLSDGYTVAHPPAVAPGASPQSTRFSMMSWAGLESLPRSERAKADGGDCCRRVVRLEQEQDRGEDEAATGADDRPEGSDDDAERRVAPQRLVRMSSRHA